MQNYYEIFKKYIQICVVLLAVLNSNRRDNFINDEVEKFVEEEFADETLQEIKNTINNIEIKNALTQSRGEVYKFNLKVYTFVYDKIIFLPHSETEYDTITTNFLYTFIG